MEDRMFFIILLIGGFVLHLFILILKEQTIAAVKRSNDNLEKTIVSLQSIIESKGISMSALHRSNDSINKTVIALESIIEKKDQTLRFWKKSAKQLYKKTYST
jgi:hypothetical protein